MSFYSGRHAELYDIFYAEKSYEQEAAFVDKCIKKYGNEPSVKILEIACGTGTHAIEFSRLGYNVTAIDYSEDMLVCARKKAKKSNMDIVFYNQDMSRLSIEGASFDVSVCLFDSIGYVKSNEAIDDVFLGVRKYLRPGGLFIFEFWHAAAMLIHYESLRVKKWVLSDSEIMRVSETKLNYAEQLAEVKYTIYELFRNGEYTNFQEVQTNRFFLLQEMKCFLAKNGYTLVNAYNGFELDEAIDEKTWHIVAVARVDNP